MIKIKSDSRKIKPGDIFIALRGISSDGHSYIEEAIKRGAAKVIAEEGSYSVDTLIVEDTRKYLEEYLFNNYGYLFNKIKLIGITGTNGKTSTAFYIYQALNKLGAKCAYVGNLGFYLDKLVRTLPNNTNDLIDNYELIYEAVSNGCSYFVMEVSSQGLDFGRVNGLLYNYAVFTNLSHDHLDHHKTMENYAIAKTKLFKQLKEEGIGLINLDNEYHKYFIMDNIKLVTYGYSDSDYQIINHKIENRSIEFSYKIGNKVRDIKINLIGKHNIYNILVTAIILECEGYSFEEIKKVMLEVTPPEGRMEIINYKSNFIIIDYAHDPVSMNNVLDIAKEITKGNIYTVFGCTGDRDRAKRPIMFDVATTKSNYVIITSDDLHFENPNNIIVDMINQSDKTNYEVILDRRRAIEKGISLLKENDCLLVLGKGHEKVMIIGNQRIPFNDKEVVDEILNEALNH